MSNPRSTLDPGQIIKDAYDEANQRIRTDASVTAVIPDVEVAIDAASGDNIAIASDDGSLIVDVETIGSVNALDVHVVNSSGAGAVNVQDGGNSLTVDNSTLSVVGGGTEATALRVTVANDSTGLLSVDDNGSSLTVDGTVTVLQGTTPWVENVSQFGGSAVVTGTGNSGSGIPRVTVSNDSSITNISGTISLPTGASTLAEQQTQTASLSVLDDWDETDRAKVNPIVGQAGVQGNTGTVSANTQRVVLATDVALPTGTNSIGAVTQATASNFNAQVVGNVASAATDSGNPVKIGGIVHASPSTFTDGQRADLQQDTAGSIYVNKSGRLQSYSAFSTFTIAATATDIFTLTGSASKLVKIRSMAVSGTNSGNLNAFYQLIKRSSANTGGTSSTLTAVPHDSNNAAATATARSYTANPTLGTTVGTMFGKLIFLPLLASSNVATPQRAEIGQDGAQPIILRGTGDVLAVNMNGASITGTTVMYIYIEWTEE